MASYGVFFPRFIEDHGSIAPELLTKELLVRKGKVDINQHRADVLPAVAAIHLLPATTIPSEIERLSQYVVNALRDDRREVKEIALQNLTSSTSPNFDVNLHFKVTLKTIDAVKNVILSAADDSTLMNPSALALEFLLNSRVLLRGREEFDREVQAITDAIEQTIHIFGSSSWIHVAMKQAHEATFKHVTRDPTSLPPQSSEALIGWRKLPVARDYITIQALSRAKLVKQCVDLIEDRAEETSAMTKSEAHVALPKVLDFIETYDLMTLLNTSPYGALLEKLEPALPQFVEKELPGLIRGKKQLLERVSLVPMDTGLANELSEFVPFSRYRAEQSLETIIHRKPHGYEPAIFQGLVAGSSAALGTFMTKDVMQRLIGWFTSQSERKGLSESEQIDLLRERIRELETRIDQGELRGVEERQRDLGDLPDDVL